jgi:hypothetical protein
MPGSIKIDDGSGNYTILTNAGSLGSDKTITIPNETGTLNLQSGSVLQVVTGTLTSETTIANTSYQDTGLTASITPSSTSSKVLVIVSYNVRNNRTNHNDINGHYKLVRGSTDIDLRFHLLRGSSAHNELVTAGNIAFLDSPNTTSATTYKTQAKTGTTDSSGVISVCYSGGTDSIHLIEIGA